MDDGLRDRLAEIEAEHASLKAELRAFESDYMRHVGVIMVQVHDLDARILAVAGRTLRRARRPRGRARGRRAGGARTRRCARSRSRPGRCRPATSNSSSARRPSACTRTSSMTPTDARTRRRS